MSAFTRNATLIKHTQGINKCTFHHIYWKRCYKLFLICVQIELPALLCGFELFIRDSSLSTMCELMHQYAPYLLGNLRVSALSLSSLIFYVSFHLYLLTFPRLTNKYPNCSARMDYSYSAAPASKAPQQFDKSNDPSVCFIPKRWVECVHYFFD